MTNWDISFLLVRGKMDISLSSEKKEKRKKKKGYDWACWPSQSRREGDSSASSLPYPRQLPPPESTMFANKGTPMKASNPAQPSLASLSFVSLSDSLSLSPVSVPLSLSCFSHIDGA